MILFLKKIFITKENGDYKNEYKNFCPTKKIEHFIL